MTNNTNKKTEWIVVSNNPEKGDFQFEVPFKWLVNVLNNFAKQDAVHVSNDIERYIEGRTGHLYELLSHDEEFTSNVYEIAHTENAILKTQYLHAY